MDKEKTENDNRVFNEKLWELIRTILKRRPRININDVWNRIKMSQEGKYYEKKDIVECIDMAIENGFLIVDENGTIAEAGSKKDDFRSNLKVELKELENNMTNYINAQKQEEAKKLVGGYYSRRNDDGRGSRFN